jgi:hydrogenase nickel incorporation protein HypA/HybF
MQEFSLCRGIVQGVRDEFARLDPSSGKLKAARVAIGDLHQVVDDTLKFAYESMVKGTEVEGSHLEIRPVPVELKCKSCSWQGGIKNNVFLCGRCQSSDVEVLRGMEMVLENLSVERP